MSFIYRTLGIILALLFIILGLAISLIPWSADIRTMVVDWILESSTPLSLLGLSFMFIGFSYLAYRYINRGKTYYSFRSDTSLVHVNETVIHDYLETYWKELFPHMDIPFQFELKKKKMVIQAAFPYMPKPEQEAIVERVDTELSDILKRLLGYPNKVRINLSFDRSSK